MSAVILETSRPPSDAALNARDRRARILLWIVAIAAFLATLVIYRPYRSAPFDFVDFSEFLPLLKRGASFSDRLGNLLEYYGGVQGRWNVVAYVAMAAKWSIWGDSPVAWQWLRFMTMWAIICLTYRLLRALGVTWLGAAAGASIFLVAPPAVDGWTRLTMAEPLGTVLILVLCSLMMANQRYVSDRSAIILVALLSLLLVLVKEMMVVALFLPVALSALTYHGDVPFWRAVQFRRRTMAVGAGAIVGLVPVAIVALSAPGDAYTNEFGARLRPLGDIAAHWTLGVIPFGVGSAFPARLVGLALLAFIGMIVAGWRVRLRHATSTPRRDAWILAIALALPLLGALAYVPWPSYNRFYAIPFLLGGSLLVALAISGLQTHAARLAPTSVMVWVIFLVFGAADAAALAARQTVRQRVNRILVARLAGLKDRSDTVLLAAEQQPPTFWQGIGPTLQRYGEAYDLDMPVIINERCNTARARAQAGEKVVIFYQSLCPNTVTNDPIVQRYWRVALPSPRPVVDSMRVDVVVPSPASQRNGRSP